jgi:nucleotide-binding universal stress UspA family protein
MNAQASENARRIVVGVDGSPGSVAALRWAMTEAQLTNATIEAVITWQEPVTYGYSYGWMPPLDDASDIATIMAKVLDDSIAAVSASLTHPVAVLPVVLQGHPIQMLLDTAAGAQMLVVGSRGHSTFAGVLLGSVSQHCVQHAPCPVVVVPQ